MNFVTFHTSNTFTKAMKREEQNDDNYRKSLQDLYARQELQFTFNQSLKASFLDSDHFYRFIQSMITILSSFQDLNN